MTGTINETSYRTAEGSALSVLSTETALVPVLLLLALLVLNEALRAYRTADGPASPPTGLYVAILPLAFVAGCIIAVRIMTILNWL